MERFGSNGNGEEQPQKVGNYFTAPKTNLEFIPSGCKVFDCALGGGWPLGRISNIVGDKASGKTLVAIEACANFSRQFTKGNIYYREAEAAFDNDYAQALGMPIDRVDFGDGEFFTVEDLFEDLESVLKELPKGTPGLYIIDSLDALSDRDEIGREIDKASMGAQKAKLMSQLFRRLIRRLNEKRIHVMFISQIRDKINAFGFGRKTDRSGGHALDFYASQIVYLSRIKTLEKTKKDVKRAVGILVKAHLDKNKVALPYREAEFEISFGFGIDDLKASLDWLEEVKRLSKDERKVVEKQLLDVSDEDFLDFLNNTNRRVETVWREIEQSFMPSRVKYV